MDPASNTVSPSFETIFSLTLSITIDMGLSFFSRWLRYLRFCVPITCLLVVISAQGMDVFVLLSGGVSPMANNYSQFLQAKAVSTWLERTYPDNPKWIFFGAGNLQGLRPVFSDVRRQVERDGLTLDTWIPGALPHNRPARREVFLRALREEILPLVADGGTLYLFVGDHGSRTSGDEAQSLINLWQYSADSQANHGWKADDKQSLTVADLRKELSKGLGRGKVVFCMTQCHSGGFHYLSVPHDLHADPAWFLYLPKYAGREDYQSLPLVAGFAATDEYSLASGCDPDPDPQKWGGYERYVAEKLTGMDLMAQIPQSRMLMSFSAAHAQATLADATIDKPVSTSEQFLERWANLIEIHLSTNRNLKPNIKKQVAVYLKAVDGATVKETDPGWLECQEQFHRYTEKLTDENPTTRRLLLAGTRRELERVIRGHESTFIDEEKPVPTNRGRTNQPPNRGRRGRGGVRGPNNPTRQLWSTVLRPAWQKALAEGHNSAIPTEVVEFEKHILSQENETRDFFNGRGRSGLVDELFWHGGFGDPATMNTEKAETLSRWVAERRSKILGWARYDTDEAVRSAAEKLTQPPTTPQKPAIPQTIVPAVWPLRSDVAAERTLFYRRVLAAWEFLILVQDRPALEYLRQLRTLERTPLPTPK